MQHHHSHDKHDHGHHHDHHGYHHTSATLTSTFYIGIVLNSIFVVLEVVAGFWTNSLALLTDAGHNLGDVAGLVLVLISTKIAKRKPTGKYTYGFGKTTVLVALINAALLLIAVGAIGWEAIGRINSTVVVQGKIVSIVAIVGIITNATTAILLLKEKEKDLNVKGAYLHMASDALVSFGVMLSGIIIYFTHWFFLDIITCGVIIVLIIASTWNLLQEALKLTLDGVPSGIDVNSVRAYLLGLEGVKGIHDLHIWALSTKANALTSHIIMPNGATDAFLVGINRDLHEKFNIDHSTIQVESSTSTICEQDC